jgi:hypothetical protein
VVRARVTFVGFEQFWMEHAVRELSRRFNDEFDFRWLLWPSDNRGRLGLLWATATSRLVIRMGMPFEFQSESNRAWLTLVPLLPWVRPVNYWIGYDVMDFLQRLEADQLSERDKRASRHISHITVTEHLATELRSAGLHAQNAELMGTESIVPGLAPLPDRFRVLGYWNAQSFPVHLSGPAFYDAAQALPDTEFLVLGDDGSGSPPAPPNVTFLGRLEDPVPVYTRCVVLVRQTDHDSVPSGMIEEMLLLGRHVIYTYPWPHTITVPHGDSDALIRELLQLRDAFNAGTLPLNEAGREFTVIDSDPERRAASVRSALLEILAGRL